MTKYLFDKEKKHTEKRLARRLVSRVLMVMLLISFVIAMVQIIAMYDLEKEGRNISIRNDISNLSPILKNNLWTYELNEINSIVDAFMRNPYISAIRILDDKGKIIKEQGKVIVYTELPARDLVEVDMTSSEGLFDTLIYQYKLIYTQHRENELVGYVQLYAPGHLIFEQIKNVIIIISLSFSLALLAFSLFFYRIQQRVVADPIFHLTRVIEAIAENLESAEKDQSFDQTLLQRQDEIGDLARSYYDMRDSLYERDHCLLEQQKNLETIVEKRTFELKISNRELEKSLERLQFAQQDLIESEKMAALGALVSGVAHEVNTPLGVSITAASHLSDTLNKFSLHYRKDELTRKQMDTFLSECSEMTGMLESNLERSAKLVKSFKQVAVDQTYEDKRELDLKAYLNEILISLKPTFKHTQISVSTNFDDDIRTLLYPGALAQVINNLMMNAFMHAFENGEDAGEIELTLKKQQEWIRLKISDNGKGMTDETLSRVFDPFYTTKRHAGGSGLGMHICYNIITQKLKGKIKCQSQWGEGTSIDILLPITIDS